VPAARALIVDDSSLARAVIAEALRSHGIDIVGEAADGISAFEAYQRLRPDVVTMDLTMPGVDGLTALRSIVTLDARARIVVISVAGQEDVVLEALQAGALGFVLKPFEPHQLSEVLRRAGMAGPPATGDDERRRLYVFEAQRRIEALGEDVRDLAGSPGDQTLLESIRRHAQVLVGMSARMQDRPTGKLSLAVERLASAARSTGGAHLPRCAAVLQEAVVGLSKLLLACARREDDSMFADALSERLDGAVEAARAASGDVEDALGRALVVDPDRFNRRVIEGFLRREGFQINGVEDLTGALEQAATGSFALVIVAADPARLDGLAALRRLRGQPGTARAAILLLTPRPELSEKLAAFQAGADDVVVTPFEPEEVVARVQAIVGRLRRGGTNFAGAAG
jgi:two-component system chemotaxis response regulator CheY